jgi:lysophospholipase L1-like esterase
MIVRLAVLGDSIAYGVGATRPQDALGPRLVRALDAAGRPAQCRVFAVPGARSADLARQVPAATAWRPHVAVIVIGANDLTRFVAPREAAGQLADAVRRLRAEKAEVVVAPAPDLSVVPHVPPALRELVRTASARLRREQERAAVAAGARIADVTNAVAVSFAADRTLFSGDLFHPSSAGYAIITEALVPQVRAALPPAERTGAPRRSEPGSSDR